MNSMVNARSLGVVLVFVLGVGLAFYGGRVYQNNIDQPLFTQYSPAATGGARASGAAGASSGGSFFGGGSSGGSQSAAALAYATPPGGSSTNPATAGAPAAGGSGQGGPATGAQATSSPAAGGSGAVGGMSAATATDVSGILMSLTGSELKLKTSDGSTVTLSIAGATHFYVARLSDTKTLAKGQLVTATLQQSSGAQGFSADTITIAPAGTLYGYVKTSQADTSGFPFSPAGTVASVTKGTLNVEERAGRTMALALTSATKVYQLISTTNGAMTVGSTVSVLEKSGGGAPVADNVVASSISGTVASLTAAPARRAGGFGGAAGGAQGGASGGTQAPSGAQAGGSAGTQGSGGTQGGGFGGGN